jgi:hypothetical protein
LDMEARCDPDPQGESVDRVTNEHGPNQRPTKPPSLVRC